MKTFSLSPRTRSISVLVLLRTRSIVSLYSQHRSRGSRRILNPGWKDCIRMIRMMWQNLRENMYYCLFFKGKISYLTFSQRSWVFATNTDFLNPISLQPNVVDPRRFKLWILLDKIPKFYIIRLQRYREETIWVFGKTQFLSDLIDRFRFMQIIFRPLQRGTGLPTKDETSDTTVQHLDCLLSYIQDSQQLWTCFLSLSNH